MHYQSFGHRVFSSFTLFFFLFSSVVSPSALASDQFLEVPGQRPIPVIDPSEVTPASEDAFDYPADFPTGHVLTLTRPEPEELPAVSESRDYERYTVEQALELLSEDYAAAVVLESLDAGGVELLRGLDFETAVIVEAG